MSMLSNVQNHWHPWHWFVFEQEDSPSMFEDDLRCRWWWWWSNTTLLPILPQRATRCASRGWRFLRFLHFLHSPPPNQTCVPVKNVVGVAMVFNNTNKVSIPSDQSAKTKAKRANRAKRARTNSTWMLSKRTLSISTTALGWWWLCKLHCCKTDRTWHKVTESDKMNRMR